MSKRKYKTDHLSLRDLSKQALCDLLIRPYLPWTLRNHLLPIRDLSFLGSRFLPTRPDFDRSILRRTSRFAFGYDLQDIVDLVLAVLVLVADVRFCRGREKVSLRFEEGTEQTPSSPGTDSRTDDVLDLLTCLGDSILSLLELAILSGLSLCSKNSFSLGSV